MVNATIQTMSIDKLHHLYINMKLGQEDSRACAVVPLHVIQQFVFNAIS